MSEIDSKLLLKTLIKTLCSTDILTVELLDLLDDVIKTARKEGYQEAVDAMRDLATLQKDECCGCGGCGREYQWKDYIATTEGTNPDYSELPDELRKIAERWDAEKVEPLLNMN